MKQIIALTGLLALALAGSYWTWTEDVATKPASSSTDVAVYDSSEQDLQKIHWESEKLSVDVEQRTDAKGKYLWVTATERKEIGAKEPPKPDAAPTDGDAPEDAPAPAPEAAPASPPEGAAPAAPATPEAPKQIETKVVSFRGGEAADKLWSSFGPLHALRELGLPADADLSQYGLDKPTATVTVTRANGTTEIRVGGETYGAKDRYVMVGTKSFLLAQDTLKGLEFAATRLVERRLQPFPEEKLDKVEVTGPDGKALSFVQTNKDDKEKAFWAKAEAPSEEWKAGDAWVGKLVKLNIKLYVDEKDVAGPLTPVFTYATTSGGETWTVEVDKAAGDNPEFYARSDFDRGLTNLPRSLASELAADLADLMQ